ncbi:MAG: acetoacetate--CoA ligase [Candidatus Marinimicrobia bacterium]|jgi:acetoacetyl-CoA synthetase|nr:acetoacetate--CoA ligase [Candidatus Neomarinimicrobiota bacterium]MBT3618726.1 acetoacetate--CoA ligase [Candidatus Neomarinimicrobiota bacterium]MBT3828293.1 acetoacetate--CoA ligase [Candidatus Neomarinimicrobiota bacterium]MBT3997246.1 acetoacetate--CoA ligase [Candidatus Neomarinimicrobiota bacterium]MBT4280156.1 acetoacetate--CoA ligase [Candidatus Neomarinimicrobiota bacterium]
MAKILWEPTDKQINDSQMDKFRQIINSDHNLDLTDYSDLYAWSVQHVSTFWNAAWKHFNIIHSTSATEIVDDPGKMPGAKWFSGAQLNYAENLLRFRDNNIAICFKGEGQPVRKITYAELFKKVSKLAAALKKTGVKKGDRVVGFIPNVPEAVIAMLATASIGAIWSSSSPDFGIKGVLDRFSQIEPKILFSANGYFYNGKTFDSLDKLSIILKKLPSVEKVIVVPYSEKDPDISSIPTGILYDDFISTEGEGTMEFEQFPFDHPLYIMYSSGTTGLPKSIVHGAGGTLIQHLKELQLHTNLSRNDTIFYFTTTGWMMWNWLVSSLAVGATVVLYDGSPFYPDSSAMWRLAEELRISIFGTSAKFIDASESAGEVPFKNYDLKKLRTILSTGSPLIEENFDYVYREVKKDVQLSSISGGTDIISCFALGNPTLPVYRGELQCRGLGMKVESFNEGGNAIQSEKGELVCTAAFPSMPIYFWNDEDGSKYSNAYFDTYPNIWHHGDYIEINEHGGVTIYGRSDATLNPGGVRIGTAEIYRVVENLPEIEDSLVIGQDWNDDQRIILFVKLNENKSLTKELIKTINSTIRKNCSPRHVPAKILSIADIPYTINLKKVEIAVRKIIHGEKVKNKDALVNPESLELYRDLIELKK